jgi:hypothetical protein
MFLMKLLIYTADARMIMNRETEMDGERSRTKSRDRRDHHTQDRNHAHRNDHVSPFLQCKNTHYATLLGSHNMPVSIAAAR